MQVQVQATLSARVIHHILQASSVFSKPNTPAELLYKYHTEHKAILRRESDTSRISCYILYGLNARVQVRRVQHPRLLLTLSYYSLCEFKSVSPRCLGADVTHHILWTGRRLQRPMTNTPLSRSKFRSLQVQAITDKQSRHIIY